MKDFLSQNPSQEQAKRELDLEIKQKYMNALLDKDKIFEFVSTVPSWSDNFGETEKDLLWKLCVYFEVEMGKTELFEGKKSELFKDFDKFASTFTDMYSKTVGIPRSIIYPNVNFMIKIYLESIKRNS